MNHLALPCGPPPDVLHYQGTRSNRTVVGWFLIRKFLNSCVLDEGIQTKHMDVLGEVIEIIKVRERSYEKS
jgi:hypothetical protein